MSMSPKVDKQKKRQFDALALARKGYELHKAGDIVGAVHAYQRSIAVYPTPDALHHAALAARHLSQLGRRLQKGEQLAASARLMLLAVQHATAIAQQVAEQAPDDFANGTGAAGAARRLYAAMVHNYAWFQKDSG